VKGPLLPKGGESGGGRPYHPSGIEGGGKQFPLGKKEEGHPRIYEPGYRGKCGGMGFHFLKGGGKKKGGLLIQEKYTWKRGREGKKKFFPTPFWGKKREKDALSKERGQRSRLFHEKKRGKTFFAEKTDTLVWGGGGEIKKGGTPHHFFRGKKKEPLPFPSRSQGASGGKKKEGIDLPFRIGNTR